MRTVGVVLAGGLSRRFGTPKAFARIGEMYFYEHALHALHPFCEEIVVVTRRELLGRFPSEVAVTTDVLEFEGCGPLAGILSAMEFVEADRYVVLPCDMPFIDEAVIRKLIAQHTQEVTTVIVEGRVHPLISVWDCKVKSTLRKTLQSKQLRVMAALDQVDVVFIEGHTLTENVETVFVNVNRPTDLERG